MKTALVYLEGKLSTARALLRVEIESYTARRTSPPEELQTAYRQLDAFLKTDQRGKAGRMAQLKSAIDNLLELSRKKCSGPSKVSAQSPVLAPRQLLAPRRLLGFG
jgi:hypothetical protein